MAIVFAKQKKIQKNLILVLIFIVIIALIILWQGFSKKEVVFFPGEVLLPAPKEVEIDFKILEHPRTKELMPFAEIEPFEEVAPTEDEPGQIKGRENPFIAY